MIDPTTLFSAEECREFFLAWDNWRAGEIIPNANAVNLNDVASLKPIMSILEVHSAEVAIMRMMGTDFFEHFGQDITGLNFVDLAPESDRLLRGYRQFWMSRQPCGSRTLIVAENQAGLTNTAEIAAFPVGSGKTGKSPQIYTVTKMLQHNFLPADDDQELVVPMANEFSFLDIGAGVPEMGSGFSNM